MDNIETREAKVSQNFCVAAKRRVATLASKLTKNAQALLAIASRFYVIGRVPLVILREDLFCFF
jgi:hypothetical protein